MTYIISIAAIIIIAGIILFFRNRLSLIFFKSGWHPDTKNLIKEVFKINDKRYYEYKNYADMPAERYMELSELINEADMKIDRDTLKKLLKIQEEHLNSGAISKAMVINEDIQRRMELFFEKDTLYRIAACVFFTLEEDIYTFDYDYAEQKIEEFKKSKKVADFFLNTPIRKFMPQTNISPKDFEVLLKMSEVENQKTNYTLTTANEGK